MSDRATRVARLFGLSMEEVEEAARRAEESERSLIELLLDEGRIGDNTIADAPTQTPAPRPTEGSLPRDLPKVLPGNLRVLEQLGAGGMGRVFLARDETLERDVVVKTLAPGLEDHEDFRVRFLREARAAAKLASHPNIVTVHAAGIADGLPYMVLQHVSGDDLAERLQEGPLSPKEACQRILEAARGVHAAHQAGIIHRDLKPANLILGPNGEAMVLDFGTARVLGDVGSLTQTGQLIGTIPFMPPEQAAGEDVDARADVYGLGATLYCLLTGQPPFPGASVVEVLRAVVSPKPARDVRDLRPDVPPAVGELVMRCLSKEPGERPPDMAAFQEELHTAMVSSLLVAGPGDGPGRPRPRSVRGLLLAILFVVAVLSAWAVPLAQRAARLRVARSGSAGEQLGRLEAFVRVYPRYGAGLDALGELRTWSPLEPRVRPRARAAMAAALDQARGRIVLFGGSTDLQDALKDTWEWDGEGWREVAGAGPSPRRAHAMAWDGEGVVLFGGEGADDVDLGDTWRWDGAAWKRLDVSGPPARSWHAMAWDAQRRVAVLYGGAVGDTTFLSDTWTWNGRSWREARGGPVPPGRADHALAWDGVGEQVLLFGGEAGSERLGDTWAWDGAFWSPRVVELAPPLRAAHRMAWDPGRKAVVLLGGLSGNETLTDTWEWGVEGWSPRRPRRSPPARAAAVLCWDPAREALFAFGGADPTFAPLDDAWSYGPPARPR